MSRKFEYERRRAIQEKRAARKGPAYIPKKFAYDPFSAEDTAEFKKALNQKAAAVKKYQEAVSAVLRTEKDLSENETRINRRRAADARIKLENTKKELEAFKLSKEQIDNLFQLYSDRIPKMQTQITSLGSAFESMGEKINQQIAQFPTLVEQFGAAGDAVGSLQQSLSTSIGIATQRAVSYGSAADTSQGKKTLQYQESILKIQSDIGKLYASALKNQQNLGSDKFRALKTDELSAKISAEIYKLNLDSGKLMEGAYGDLRMQYNELIAMMDTINKINQTHIDLNEDLLKEIQSREQSAEVTKQQLEWDKEQLQIIKEKRTETESMYAELFDFLADQAKKEQELRDAQDKWNREQTTKRNKERRDLVLMYADMFDEIEENRMESEKRVQEKIEAEQQRAQEKQQALYERRRRKFETKLISMISTLPFGGFLSLMATLGPMFALLAAVIGLILYLVTRWDKHITDIQKSMSVTRVEAEAGAMAIGQLVGKLQLANIYAPQLAETIAALGEGLGGYNLLTPLTKGNQILERMVASSAVLKDKFQLTGEEIATITDLSTATGTSLSQTTIMVERMAKGSFSVRSVFQSLAKLSPSILTSFRGTNAQLISMAANAKRLGVEMSDIIQSSMSLLDVEDAITKAFEAQVVTGKNFDIDQLMFLQVTGDYGKLLEEQEKILKETDYLNNPSPVFQNLIAGGIGLSPDAASQIALRSVLSDKLGLSQEKMREMQREGEKIQDVFDEALKTGKITEMEFQELSKIAKEYDFLTIQEKIVRSLDNLALSIGVFFGPLTKAVGDLATKFGEYVNSFMGFTHSLGQMAYVIGSVVGAIALGGLAVGGFKLARPILSAGGGLFGLGSRAATTGAGGLGATAAGANAMRAGGGGLRGMLGSAFTPVKSLGGLGGGMGLSGGLTALGGILSGQSVGKSLTEGAASAIGYGVGTYFGGPVVGMMASMALQQGAGMLYDTFTGAGNRDQYVAHLQTQAQAIDEATAQMSMQQAQGPSPFTTLESKIDTTNNLLREMVSKPMTVTIELDSEKVGKAVMSYISQNVDRNRPLGNSQGKLVDQTIVRPNKNSP